MRVHCGFVPATSSQWYTSLFYLCTTRDSFPVRVPRPYGYTARQLHVILSLLQLLQVYWRWLYACYKCVCVLHVTWPPLHVLNICPCAYCPWFCPRYTSLSPIFLFPNCTAHDLVNYCCFYNNSPLNDPASLSTLKAWIFLQSQTCTKQYALPAGCTYF